MFFRILSKSIFYDYKNTFWMLLTLTICSILIGVFLILTGNIQEQITSSFHKIGSNGTVYPVKKTTPISLQEWTIFKKLALKEGIQSTLIEVRGGEFQGIFIPICFADSTELKNMTSYWLIHGKRALQKNECLVGQRLAKKIKIAIGQHISISWGNKKKGTSFLVTGILTSGDQDENKIFATPSIFGKTMFTYGLLQAKRGKKSLQKLKNILHKKKIFLQVRLMGQMLTGEKQVIAKIKLLSGLSLIAVLILTGFGVSSLSSAKTIQHKKEYALMRAIGALKKHICQIILSESIFLGLLSSLIGFGIAIFLGRWISWKIFHILVMPTWNAFLWTILITVGVSMITVAISIIRVFHLEPAQILRGE